jgi:hypothetical protein
MYCDKYPLPSNEYRTNFRELYLDPLSPPTCYAIGGVRTPPQASSWCPPPGDLLFLLRLETSSLSSSASPTHGCNGAPVASCCRSSRCSFPDQLYRCKTHWSPPSSPPSDKQEL